MQQHVITSVSVSQPVYSLSMIIMDITQGLFPGACLIAGHIIMGNLSHLAKGKYNI